MDQHAPDFQLDDLDGKTWKLNELLADGPVVVIFYHAHCDLCARQLFADERDLPLFRAVGATGCDQRRPAGAARQRFARYGLFGFPVLWDPETGWRKRTMCFAGRKTRRRPANSFTAHSSSIRMAQFAGSTSATGRFVAIRR